METMAIGRARSADLLRKAREDAGLTQAQVAQRLGVTRVAVSNWERGDVVPRERQPQLADLYGVTLASLNLDEVSGGQSGPMSRAGVSQRVREWLAAFQLELTKAQATDEEIEEAMELLNAPQVRSYFMGGSQRDRSEADVLKGMQALADAVIRPRLRELGRKI